MALVPSAFFGSHVTRNALTVVAWASLAWDYISRLRDEYQVIWKPIAIERRPSSIANLYIFLRYGGLIGQTINMVWTMVLLSSPFIHPSVCSSWYWFQSLLIQALFGVMQYVVMLRIDALYCGDLRRRTVLLLSWLLERAALMYIAIETYRALRNDAACMVARPPVTLTIGLVATVVVVQLFAWGMTFFKIHGGPKSPLTRRLNRDGAVVCASIVVLYLVAVPYATVVDVLMHNIHAFMITMLSNMGCGLILNLQCLASDHQRSKLSHAGSTSSTWCLDTLEASVDSDGGS
ncbi:hypothetical protein LshimejAT787_0312120 [Lyophyllum shimeji]|uniref:DUF6533 domain-containing protein n=1 Tax=Lyophyllum shimeji TaxID=47721 RepID=A0A9P3UMM0_LYOSH|nr:hypothetical protein LshimejAT787_0312120 [Lyophyllum shimeji]